MYPAVPYEGISWPITQHAGVLSKTVLDGLLNACLLCNNERPNAQIINNYLIEHGILTENYRTDSNQSDAWRDYQQILSEFGLLYSTRVCRDIRLTPVAMAYLEHRIDYEETIGLQIMRYQYPNGHKSQLSPSLKASFGENFPYESYTEMQDALNICFRPAVLVLQILYALWSAGEQSVITLDEMQTYVGRCLRHSDVEACVRMIVNGRNHSQQLAPLPRARRNMADWMRVLNQTALFTLSYDGDHISLSGFSIRKRMVIQEICSRLSQPDSFWYYSEGDFKQKWFDFYGNFYNSTDYIIKTT